MTTNQPSSAGGEKTELVHCALCNGTGRLDVRSRGGCPDCEGTGEIQVTPEAERDELQELHLQTQLLDQIAKSLAKMANPMIVMDDSRSIAGMEWRPGQAVPVRDTRNVPEPRPRPPRGIE